MKIIPSQTYRFSDSVDGIYRLDDEGRIIRIADEDILPDDWLTDVIRARQLIPDPGASEYILVPELPESGDPHCVYILYGDQYDGKVYEWQDDHWVSLELSFTNSALNTMIMERGLYKACIFAIDLIVSRIDPQSWIVSANRGAENTSFASLADVLNFYTRRKADLLDQERVVTKRNGGGHFRCRTYPIGGEYNYEY